ncbi:hypothetical protein C9374_009202 [Naegleria lovaniensis]|uniref:Adenylate kinase n=1 Tax=Naegleria lovaniensis TaxID=51637 RepID=A0AA88GI96_NAELO|nr:uncharacterized protein C9374_009202 [Naegleria lovaniensis]KAG2377686.1 hypothetical protein C9374_009202 [Naegleria lovaniensis]
MSSIRSVYLLSTNPLKLPEYTRNFDRYGVRVVLFDPSEYADDQCKLNFLLKHAPQAICFIADQMDLWKKGQSGERAKLEHLELVESCTELTVWQLNKEKDAIVKKVYKNTQLGFIDLSRKKPNLLRRSVFGWDDVFVNVSTGMSNLEQIERSGVKISSRDMAISEFIRERFYYSKRRDLQFTPQHAEKTIDFKKSVLHYFETHNLYNNESTAKYKVTNIWKTVANEGIVLKSAINRRQYNYFSTLLNPALPLVSKKDPIHETTFQVHDCGHFLILELVYTGYETTDLHKLVYITFRMISEAVTMMIADILFIHALKQQGIEYDFDSRKIYPLYSSSNLDFDRDGIVPTLEKLVRANVDYALKGDDTKFRAIASEPVLKTFKDKFGPFFVEDYKWNTNNYLNMESRKEEIRKWWDSVEHVRGYIPDIRFLTIDEFISRMEKYHNKDLSLLDNECIVDLVFETVWNEIVKPVFEKDDVPLLPEGTRNYNAFVRYMIGQMAIFSAFNIPERTIYQDGLLKFLKEKSKTKSITINEIENAVSFYSAFVDLLAQKSLITFDDAFTYKEIYPMFEPCYVFYDENKTYYDSIANVYKKQFHIPHRIIILGKPGSGKGTQSQMIAEKYGLIHISTGDLVRAEVKAQTELGKKCDEIMNTGKLLPDELINPIFLKRILQKDCREKGWILDGYPRTDSNLQFVRDNRLTVTCVLCIDVSDELAIERQCGRLVDPQSGKIYHASLLPPSDDIKERLTKRATDNEEKAKIRMKVYHEEMGKSDKWFSEEITFHVDGSLPPEEVFKQIEKILK